MYKNNKEIVITLYKGMKNNVIENNIYNKTLLKDTLIHIC